MSPIVASSLIVLCMTGGPFDASAGVSFGSSSQVLDALWANERAFLLVGNELRQNGTVVYLEGSTLLPWTGALQLEDVGALGRDKQGRPIAVMPTIRLASSTVEHAFNVLEAPMRLRHLPKVRSAPLSAQEVFIRRLSSTPDSFITSQHLCRLEDPNVWVSIDGLPLIDAADISNETILAGMSVIRDYGKMIQQACLKRIDVRTGKGRNVLLDWGQMKSLDSDSIFDPARHRISGILCDPTRPGSFYVGTRHHMLGGGLLCVGPDDKAQVVYFDEIDDRSGIQGLRKDRAIQRDIRQFYDPVVAMCAGLSREVYFMTYQSVYRIGESGQPEVIGTPRFENVGGFWVSRNLPGLIVVLSLHADMGTNHVARHSSVLMIAIAG